MQMHDLQTLYPQFQSALAAFPDNTIALCLYESRDRVYFHAYPQPAFGFPTSTFPAVLPELKTVFAVQATGVFIRAAIDAATMMGHHEIDIGCGYSIRVFDDAAQLASAAGHCQSYAFVRADACLVVWADSVNTVMPIWHDVMFCLQSQFGGALLHLNQMPELSGNTYGIDPLLLSNTFDVHPPQQGGFSQPSADALSSLSELSFLETFNLPNTPPPMLGDAQYTDPATWFWGQNTSPGMGLLQDELQMLNTTSEPPLANDGPPYSFGDTPLTVNLATISPPPVGVFDLSQEEDPSVTSSASSSSSCGLSLDLASDGPLSPSSFSQSQSPSAQQNIFTDALSFRRHSVGPSSAPEQRTVGHKTKRDGGDGTADEDEHCDDVDESYSPAHTSKRRRAAGAMMISKATSAPARFIVPLPVIVESTTLEKNDVCDDDDASSISSGSQSQSHSLAPLSPTPSLTPAPTPPARKARGRSRRTPRTKCEFCPKTFSRMQDAERHAKASCPDNPSKAGVPCPECGEVLSRQDSAQRHWRGHEKPGCEPPEWAHSST